MAGLCQDEAKLGPVEGLPEDPFGGGDEYDELRLGHHSRSIRHFPLDHRVSV
jgi:hypothetical protein